MSHKTIDQWFEEYSESHQNPVNKLIHWVCVPGIFLVIIALLWTIPLPAAMAEVPYLNWATLAMIIPGVFYFRLSPKLFIGLALFILVCVYAINWYVQANIASLLWTAVIAFIVLWIFQFIGHHIEGKKPSFFKDIQFLLIGPAWVIGFIYRKLGLSY